MGHVRGSIYRCDFCGHEADWMIRDRAHEELWGCERCGRCFCGKCVKEIAGDDGYFQMRMGEKALCPDCLKRVAAEE